MRWKYFAILILCVNNLSAQIQQTNAPATYKFSVQQCIEYEEKNNDSVKNALLNIQLQQQVNRAVTAAAYPQINGSINAQYNPNIAVQTIPDFITPLTYGVLTADVFSRRSSVHGGLRMQVLHSR